MPCHAYGRGVSNETLAERNTAPLPVTEAPVIVGYSGTDESHDALALTRELARLMRSPVVAVSVVTTAPLETDIRTYTAEVRKQTERLRAESKEALAGLDEVEPVAVLAPSPARELDRIAGEREQHWSSSGPPIGARSAGSCPARWRTGCSPAARIRWRSRREGSQGRTHA